MKSHALRKLFFTVASILMLVLFTACAGVGTNANGTITITGTITKVDPPNHSVTLNVGGQNYTINGLSDQDIQALQSQQGKTYTVVVTKNSDGSYNINAGTNPTPAPNQTPGVSETPEPSETPNGTEPASSNASISLVATAQNVSGSSLSVTLPDNTQLTIAITAQTDKSDLNGAQVSNGQKIKVDANASSSGFTATKIKLADASDDTNAFEFKGTTTQAVGSDHILHVKVGNQTFSYALGSSADLGDFNNNASSINSGAQVKVKVQFNGSAGTITKVSNANS
ncbi:MAG TPA: hypothetical protein VF458_09790 [Ktedonobacteraceae bacterium]